MENIYGVGSVFAKLSDGLYFYVKNVSIHCLCVSLMYGVGILP